MKTNAIYRICGLHNLCPLHKCTIKFNQVGKTKKKKSVVQVKPGQSIQLQKDTEIETDTENKHN